jgi:hypothetical protein
MAALIPTTPTAQGNTQTVTGATGVATLIFDGRSHAIGWHVEISNHDATAGDGLYIGYDSTIDVDAGIFIGTEADGTTSNRWNTIVPPGTVIYANCTSAETRLIYVAAVPLA